MLKILIKKQFRECFRSYFVNNKSGKARTKAGMIGMFAFFAGLMLFLAGFFFGMSYLLGLALFETDLGWLLYAIMSIASLSLGVFGSVFNTYASLYMSKDNEQLLSMPIPPSAILLSRVVLVYGLSLLYSGIVWVPVSIYGCIFGPFPVIGKIMGVLLTPVIALLVTVLTCALGWIVALIASRLKNKSFLVVILTLAFLGIYYYVCGNMSDIMDYVIHNVGKVQKGMKTWGALFYQIGMAASGDGGAMLVFCGITLVLTVICYLVLTRSFIGIVTRSSDVGHNSGKIKDGKQQSMTAALFRKELKRFTASSTYMMNCGLGIVFMLGFAVFVLIRRDMIQDILSGLSMFLPDVKQFLPMVLALAVSMITGMNVISTPSISLEGKNLWVLQTLPVNGKQIMQAKLKLHMCLNMIPAVISALVLGYCTKQDLLSLTLVLFFVCLNILLNGVFGLVIGVLRPNFSWTSETMPIKQSLNVLLSMLVSWIVPVILGGSYYFLYEKISVQTHMGICVAVLLILNGILYRYLMTKGARKLELL